MSIIAIDFDGTIVEHEYPDVGPPVPGAIETMKQWIADGHRLILWTMRSGETLEAAVAYCRANGVEFWGVNENPEQTAEQWSTSPKQYAMRYVDDAAVGCPLVANPYGRPYVDWAKVVDIMANPV